MQKKNLKAAAFSLAMVALMLLPLTMNAQYKEHQFGLQEWGQTSLLGRQDGGNRSGGSGGYNISTEQIGAGGGGGYLIGTEQIGQNAPLGSGLFIMAAAGAAYAFRKRNKNNKNTIKQ